LGTAADWYLPKIGDTIGRADTDIGVKRESIARVGTGSNSKRYDF